MIEKIISFYNNGITVSPERYETLKKAHKGLMQIGELAGEALEEMGPEDETPFQLTGGEIVEKTLAKISDKLGN